MARTLIIDSNVAARWYLAGPPEETIEAWAIYQAIASRTIHILVPDLFVSEVLNAIWLAEKTGAVARPEAEMRVKQFLASLTEFHFADQSSYAQEAFLEAVAAKHPVYDMVYLAVAKAYAIPLVTADRKLYRIAETSGVEAVSLSNWSEWARASGFLQGSESVQ